MLVTSKFKTMNPNQIHITTSRTNNHHALVNDRRSSRASASGFNATAVICAASPCARGGIEDDRSLGSTLLPSFASSQFKMPERLRMVRRRSLVSPRVNERGLVEVPQRWLPAGWVAPPSQGWMSENHPNAGGSMCSVSRSHEDARRAL